MGKALELPEHSDKKPSLILFFWVDSNHRFWIQAKLTISELFTIARNANFAPDIKKKVLKPRNMAYTVTPCFEFLL